MAGQPISVTRGSTTVTATTVQSAKEAIDLQGVSGIRFDFALRSYFISGSGALASVEIKTAMFNDDNPSNWKPLVTFTDVGNPNFTEVMSVSEGVLRYIRWEVTMAGTSPSFTFEILGMSW